MLTPTFVEKYSPKTIDTMPFDNKFNSIIHNFININLLQIILVSDDSFSKNCVVNAIINTLNLKSENIMFLKNCKDHGVSNIRSEVKLFSQIAKSNKNVKRILIIEDIETYSDNIQKLFINNIDKWSQNINVIITSNNLFNINESLTSRLLPISIPKISQSTINRIITEISTKEEIKLTEPMRKLILTLSENNLLSVYHILHKCSLLQESITLTEDIIKNSCTIIHVELLEQYIEYIKNKDIQSGYNHLLSIVDNGYSVIDILNELYIFVKITNRLKENEKYSCFKIISAYIVTFITIHEEELELLILTNDLTKII